MPETGISRTVDRLIGLLSPAARFARGGALTAHCQSREDGVPGLMPRFSQALAKSQHGRSPRRCLEASNHVTDGAYK
jgi:hypothetical protein